VSGGVREEGEESLCAWTASDLGVLLKSFARSIQHVSTLKYLKVGRNGIITGVVIKYIMMGLVPEIIN